MNKAEKLKRLETAKHQLEEYRPEIMGNHLLLISQRNGQGLTSYMRVILLWVDKYGNIQRACLHWALAVVFGYPLKEMDGEWHLAISGYGFDKRLEVTRLIENYYGVAALSHGRI